MCNRLWLLSLTMLVGACSASSSERADPSAPGDDITALSSDAQIESDVAIAGDTTGPTRPEAEDALESDVQAPLRDVASPDLPQDAEEPDPGPAARDAASDAQDPTAPPCPPGCTLGDKACDGPLVQECLVGPDGCPAMGTVADCAAIGLTCVPPGECGDTNGQGDDPPPDGLLCPQFSQCLLDACPDDNTTECLTSAFNAVCQPQAATPTEGMLYLSLNSCMGTHCQETANYQVQMQCIADHCLSNYAKCFGGGQYGAGSCEGIAQCIADNECSGTSSADFACARSCYQQGSEPANEDFWKMQLCITGQCYGEDDFGACAASDATIEACQEVTNICLGINTGEDETPAED